MATNTLELPTESQPLTGKPFDVWTSKGYDIFRRLQATENAHEQSQWEIGEWLVAGLKKFDEKTSYKTAAEITGWTVETLRNDVWVVRRFMEQPSLRSDTKLKWSHFKELAPIKDEKKRLALLEKLDDGLPITVLQVRAEVDKVLDKEKKPAKHGAAKAFYLHTSLTYEEKSMFKALAKKRKKTPDKLLQVIVREFIAEHEDEIPKLAQVKGKKSKARKG